jgi:hypothetical protein
LNLGQSARKRRYISRHEKQWLKELASKRPDYSRMMVKKAGFVNGSSEGAQTDSRGIAICIFVLFILLSDPSVFRSHPLASQPRAFGVWPALRCIKLARPIIIIFLLRR